MVACGRGVAEFEGELWMALDWEYAGREAYIEARRDVRRALSEEAACEARGNTANNRDERSILGVEDD